MREDTRRCGACRRSLRAAALLMALLLGCDRGHDVDGEPHPGPAASGGGAGGELERVVIDLTARLGAADVERSWRGLNLCGPEAGHLLTAGWGAWKAGQRRASGSGAAVVEVPIVAPRRATLELELAPAGLEDGSSPQQVRAVWNGREVGIFSLPSPEAFEVPIGYDAQRIGPNRLRLEGPEGGAPEIACREVVLRPAARDPTRTPSRVAQPDGDAGSIVQPAGTVLTFHSRLPREASLHGRVERPGAADVRISFLGRGGREQTLAPFAEADAEDPAPGPVRIDQDLSDFAGRWLGVSLAVSAGDGARGEAATVAWRELRIEGLRPAPADDAPELPRAPYNVFIVMLDSLRADHVEPYQGPAGEGPAGARTPAIARLASEGVTFVGARSNASWTPPAVSSLFTSLAPSAHGVQDHLDLLPKTLPVLPGLLGERGYRSVGMTANPIVGTPFGYGRGFERLHQRPFGDAWSARHATPEAQAGFAWRRYFARAARSSGERPFFFYLHEIDPHSPYRPEPPYDALYGGPFPDGVTLDLDTITRIREEPDSLDPEDLRQLRARYRGEVSFMDRYVGWLLERLEAEGLRERTLFVLLSDHGEEFMEHRSIGHGHAVYEELLRIPLILSLPGVLPEGLRLDVGAELIDVAPTVLDLVGAEIPDRMQGRSLLPLVVRPEAQPQRRVSFATSVGGRRWSARWGPWKLIRTDPVSAPRAYELYDLEADPAETRNLWGRELVVGHALRQMLEARIARDAALRPRDAGELEDEDLEDEVAEALRKLGYAE